MSKNYSPPSRLWHIDDPLSICHTSALTDGLFYRILNPLFKLLYCWLPTVLQHFGLPLQIAIPFLTDNRQSIDLQHFATPFQFAVLLTISCHTIDQQQTDWLYGIFGSPPPKLPYLKFAPLAVQHFRWTLTLLSRSRFAPLAVWHFRPPLQFAMPLPVQTQTWFPVMAFQNHFLNCHTLAQDSCLTPFYGTAALQSITSSILILAQQAIFMVLASCSNTSQDYSFGRLEIHPQPLPLHLDS